MTLVPDKVLELQEHVKRLPQCVEIKTSHLFVDGMYCRKVWRPAGTLIIGKIHKKHHLCSCTEGEILVVINDSEKVHLKAGDVFIAQPGKKATYSLTDATLMTVHRTDLTDLDEIEKEIIEFEEGSLYDVDNKLILEKLECLG